MLRGCEQLAGTDTNGLSAEPIASHFAVVWTIRIYLCQRRMFHIVIIINKGSTKGLSPWHGLHYFFTLQI
jgi:hypothetical protein